jgi:hypothetical protein
MDTEGSHPSLLLHIDRALRLAGVDPAGFTFLLYSEGLGDEWRRFLADRFALRPHRLPEGWTNEAREPRGAPIGLFELSVEGKRAYLLADLLPGAFGERLLVALAAPGDRWAEPLRREFLAERSRAFEGTRFLYKNCCWTRFDPEIAGWGDIVLDPTLVTDLRSNLEHFFDAKAFFERHRLPYRRGFLLCGPPGNGKTLLLRILAAEYPKIAFAVFAEGQADPDDDDLDQFLDGCPLDPSVPRILVFEDLDSIFGEHRVSLSHFLNRLDGLKPLAGTLILATTNRPESIDPALLRRPSRFDRVWRLADPSYAQRRAYLRRIFGEDAARLREPIDVASRETEGFSFAMLREIFLSSAVLSHAARSESIEAAHVRQAVERLRAQDLLTRRPADREAEAVGFRAAFGSEAPVANEGS